MYGIERYLTGEDCRRKGTEYDGIRIWKNVVCHERRIQKDRDCRKSFQRVGSKKHGTTIISRDIFDEKRQNKSIKRQDRTLWE